MEHWKTSERKLSWSQFLACPICRQAVTLSPDRSVLQCIGCYQQFTIENDIPIMLSTEQIHRFDTLSNDYRLLRLSQGWQPMTTAERHALPEGAPAGYDPMYWHVRRQSFQAVLQILDSRFPNPTDGLILDLGAGTGWMAHRLATLGYSVAALESSLDPDFGLGRIKDYQVPMSGTIFPVRGSFKTLPFLPGCAAAAIFNASLHYADNLNQTIARTADLLRPDGCIIVVDSPTSKDPKPGSSFADRHLGSDALHAAFRHVGLTVQERQLFRGFRWIRFQLSLRLRRKHSFTFPVLCAFQE